MTENIAIVHEWLTTFGGSEAVVAAWLENWKSAPVHTLLFDSEGECKDFSDGREVKTSFIQKLPRATKLYRSYLPFMPLAIEQFDLGEYEIILSSSHAVAKGVLVNSDQLHITYVHTPIRYAWSLYFQYMNDGFKNPISAGIARVILHYIRLWDTLSANRVDVFLANSQNVANRIWRTYRRESQVLFPPVNVNQFEPANKREDYYVTLSRLVPYKRVDLIVKAFTKLGLPLIVLGDGPQAEYLKEISGENVTFMGYQSNETVANYLNRAKAFVFAAEEDFGITPVEAQAAGCPVIAYGKGGALETVIDGETGMFFKEQTPDSLAMAVEEFEKTGKKFEVKKLRYNADRFSKERFKREMENIVSQEFENFKQGKFRKN
ncbi:MAG: glycosyltransferase family 4 protein [Chloroflexota bacterium]